MAEIILVSTIHKEMGKANAKELCLILEKIQPDVIFLEALETSYTYYDRMRFENFAVYSSKLELKALQLYGRNNQFEYVPVLDSGMSDVFEGKYKLIRHDYIFQKMVDDLNNRVSQEGYGFLNSEACQMIHREMREYEDKMIQNLEVKKQFNDTINEYEDSMVKNIRTYCEHNQFNRAVFLCGVAHRKSLIGKLDLFVEFKVNLP
jgi:hypothetical protein